LYVNELAPPEEQAGRKASRPSNNGDGVLQAGTDNLKIPKGLIDEDDAPAHWFHLDPMVILILCFSLAFIIFIAYLIANEPLVNPK
jgi:hypothetical protein